MASIYDSAHARSHRIYRRFDTPESSTSPPGSPLCEQFLDLERLDTKLYNHQQNPPTPTLSPTDSGFDFPSSIDVDRELLINWGLNEGEIDLARRWGQKPLHHSAESIHMKLLSECVASLSHMPASLPLLHAEYERKMTEYGRHRDSLIRSGTAQARAQQAVDHLLSEMRLRGHSAEDMAKYYEATNRGEATMLLIAELCESKLKDLQRKKKPSKRTISRPRRRRSTRIQKPSTVDR